MILLTSSILGPSSAAKLYALHSDPCLESDYVYKPSPELPLGRWSFPEGFIFGTATSAYQIEGAYDIDDRIEGGGNGDVALDHYHRFEEDVQRMVYMNVDAYRFSISWPRVIPSGRRRDGISKQGIAFYHRLLDVLIENNIDPYVTIWHWDTPQLLEAEYGGFLSRNIVKDYVDYCDLLFKEYGSKVKKWITLNEPMIMTAKAYDEGVFPPGHCSPWVNRACRVGDSGIEPYIVAHNLLLAHSAAYHLYKSKYQQHLTGEIGVTYITHWFVPYSNATKDVDAAQRALDWMFGWFMDPITFGNYPRTMIDLLGSRLPKFTEEESRLLRKSFDFLGLNYYTAFYVKHNDDFDEFRSRYATDSHIMINCFRAFNSCMQLGSYWQYFYHEGLRVLLLYIKETYMDPAIYITENGKQVIVYV
ncbi:Beta-glucosidase 27 [Linum perenne]